MFAKTFHEKPIFFMSRGKKDKNNLSTRHFLVLFTLDRKISILCEN
jgi:hypothetical protein